MRGHLVCKMSAGVMLLFTKGPALPESRAGQKLCRILSLYICPSLILSVWRRRGFGLLPSWGDCHLSACWFSESIEFRFEAKSNVLPCNAFCDIWLFWRVLRFLEFCLSHRKCFLVMQNQRQFRPRQRFVEEAYPFGAPVGSVVVILVTRLRSGFLVHFIIDFYLHRKLFCSVYATIRVREAVLSVRPWIELENSHIRGARVVQTVAIVQFQWFLSAVLKTRGELLVR